MLEHVSYTNEGCIRSKIHQTEMNDFMLQFDTRASRSMDMDGWAGFMVGKTGISLGGHNDEVGNFVLFFLPVVDLPWFGVFYFAFCFSWGAVRLYLCQSQRLVKKFMLFFFLNLF